MVHAGELLASKKFSIVFFLLVGLIKDLLLSRLLLPCLANCYVFCR